MIKNFLFGRKRTNREKEIAFLIQTNFNVRPRNIGLYDQALTHKSYVKNKSKKVVHNERLEFLGDAIIGSVVAEILLKKYPTKSEGELTQMRARIVSRESLNAIGEQFGLEPFIKYHKTKNKFNSLMGNTIEALVGALFLDLGYKKTSKALKVNVFNNEANFDKIVNENKDYKSQLIIQCQRNKKTISFDLLKEENDVQGRLVFTMGINIDGKIEAQASSSTKRKAEQLAAKELLYTSN